MLYQLISTILLLFYFYSFGFLFKKVLPDLNSYFSLNLLNGMIGVGMISLVSAFFIPLNFYFEILLISISIIALIINRNKVVNFIHFFRKLPLYFYVISLVGLTISVTYPYILDHFGYYISTIKWLDFAGFVKGLSNLEWVFVQNSFWHILEASINETLDIYYRLNFVLFIVFNLYLVENKSVKLLPFNLLFLFFLNTPSPDLPVMLFSIILLNEYLEKPQKVTSYLFYAAILFVIKPISIVLIIFFLIEYFRNKDYRKLKDKNILLIGLLAFLFCLKGIILSANPLFPMSFTSIESLSWASPKSLYKLSELNGKFIPLKEVFTYDEVVKMSKIEYLKNVLFASVLRSRILLGIVILNMFIFILSFFTKNIFIRILLLATTVKVAFILISSPQFRFLIDVFVINIFIMLYFIKTSFFNKKWVIVNSLGIIFLVIPIFFSEFMTIKINGLATLGFMKNFEQKFLIEPGQYEDVKYEARNFENFMYNYPTDYPLVYSTKVPAISSVSLGWYYSNEGFPQLINPRNVRQGFYWKKLNSEEIKKLEEIIKNEQKKQVK